jgi:hypothetical protein
MNFKSPYISRPIRFLEIHRCGNWQVKVYSISIHAEFVSGENQDQAKSQLQFWLEKSRVHALENYQIATLIIHECKEGCLAVLNWWIDENMLQNFVYLKTEQTGFIPFSENGITACTWELAIIWHDRNAWVKHILKKNDQPDFDGYLNEQLNQDL